MNYSKTLLKISNKALIFTLVICMLPIFAFAQDDGINIGGALRWNYFYKDWDGQEGNQDRGGDLGFDTFRFNVDGTYKQMIISAEYRFYAGYHMIHHGWIGYNFNDETQMQFGVSQVPFGILKYASHNWFFQLPYYVGFEDDYDLGLKVVYNGDPIGLGVAFYKNDEGHYTGSSVASARYSYDVVPTTMTSNMETNQFNARLVYKFKGHTFGVSGMYGQLYNSATAETGSRYAFAGHINANLEGFNLKAEVIAYNFDPDDTEIDNMEISDSEKEYMKKVVEMGAYDFPYYVAREGIFYVAGLSYSVPVSWGPITNLTFYNDYTLMDKTEDDFIDSQNNILGVMVTAGSVYTYVDVAMGESHPWLGPDYGSALAEGAEDWHMRFNINFGYYF